MPKTEAKKKADKKYLEGKKQYNRIIKPEWETILDRLLARLRKRETILQKLRRGKK